VDLGGRHLALWDAVFDAFRDDPTGLRRAVTATGDQLGYSDAAAVDNGRFLSSVASVPSENLTLTMLAVSPVGVAGAELYATDDDEVADFVRATLSGVEVAADQIRVRLLNGNGVPGSGERAAAALVEGPFRVVLSQNADRFNYETTKIVTYDASPAGQAVARQAHDLMGVGDVLVSPLQQGIVDITIVVGKDFLRKLE
jgi:hypothetical protein